MLIVINFLIFRTENWTNSNSVAVMYMLCFGLTRHVLAGIGHRRECDLNLRGANCYPGTAIIVRFILLKVLSMLLCYFAGCSKLVSWQGILGQHYCTM